MTRGVGKREDKGNQANNKGGQTFAGHAENRNHTDYMPLSMWVIRKTGCVVMCRPDAVRDNQGPHKHEVYFSRTQEGRKPS